MTDSTTETPKVPARCACGSTTFHFTYQAWATGAAKIAADGTVEMTDVSVNGPEMHHDWLTYVDCAECGLSLRYQEPAFQDSDGNDVEDQPGLEAAAALDLNWTGTPLNWGKDEPE